MKKMCTTVIILLIAVSLFSKESGIPETTLGIPLKIPEKKSIPKAMMYSIMLPGWGDIYAGNRGTAKLLIGAEVTIWLAYFGFNYYGNIQKDNFMLYAHENAGSNLSIKLEDYYDAIEVYSSNQGYNEYIREEARTLYPDDPDKQNEYVMEYGYFNDNGWEWNNLSNHNTYRKLRVATRQTYQRAVFMTGFAILNRLCGAITSARSVRNHNNRVDEMKWGIQLQPQGIGIVYRF
jgi:hypothetical protein